MQKYYICFLTELMTILEFVFVSNTCSHRNLTIFYHLLAIWRNQSVLGSHCHMQMKLPTRCKKNSFSFFFLSCICRNTMFDSQIYSESKNLLPVMESMTQTSSQGRGQGLQNCPRGSSRTRNCMSSRTPTLPTTQFSLLVISNDRQEVHARTQPSWLRPRPMTALARQRGTRLKSNSSAPAITIMFREWWRVCPPVFPMTWSHEAKVKTKDFKIVLEDSNAAYCSLSEKSCWLVSCRDDCFLYLTAAVIQ